MINKNDQAVRTVANQFEKGKSEYS